MKEIIILLEALRKGKIGLNDYRQSLLDRIPEPGDWAFFQDGLSPKELVWLAAKTGDWFALLIGDVCVVLFHGRSNDCDFDDFLNGLLRERKLYVAAKASPDEWKEVGAERESI